MNDGPCGGARRPAAGHPGRSRVLLIIAARPRPLNAGAVGGGWTSTVRAIAAFLGLCLAVEATVLSAAVPTRAGISARPAALYETTGSLSCSERLVVPQVLLVIRNGGEMSLALLSLDGREPYCGRKASLAPQPPCPKGVKCRGERIPQKRVVLQSGDSLYVGVLLGPGTTALPVYFYTDSLSAGGYQVCLSDTINIDHMAVSRPIASEEAARAALSAVPGAELTSTRPRLDVSPRHGMVWVVQTTMPGARRTVLVGALTGLTLAVMETPDGE
jgi:hypothetical protein